MEEDLKDRTFRTVLGDVLVGRDRPVSVEEVRTLRLSVGWSVGGNYERILNEGLFTVSARLDQKVVGYLQVVGSPSGDVLIHDVCVRPEMRRQRVGTKMMELALEVCREMGLQGVNVLFEEKNLPFFRRFGFRIIKGGYLDMASVGGSGTEKQGLPLSSKDGFSEPLALKMDKHRPGLGGRSVDKNT